MHKNKRRNLLPTYRYYDISGTNTVTLSKSVGKPLKDYKIYGVTDGITDGVGDLVTDTSDTNYGKYRIPVKVFGKNIATTKMVYGQENLYSNVTEDGRNCVRFVDNLDIMYNGITFKENTQYAIQLDYKLKYKTTHMTNPNYKQSCVLTVWYTDNTKTSYIYDNRDEWTHKEIVTWAGKTVQAIGTVACSYVNWVYIDKDTFQIEEDTTATEYDSYKECIYNMYLNSPLTATDYIDFKNQCVVYSQDNTAIALPQIDTFKGTNHLCVCTTTAPSSMTVTYYK